MVIHWHNDLNYSKWVIRIIAKVLSAFRWHFFNDTCFREVLSLTDGRHFFLPMVGKSGSCDQKINENEDKQTDFSEEMIRITPHDCTNKRVSTFPFCSRWTTMVTLTTLVQPKLHDGWRTLLLLSADSLLFLDALRFFLNIRDIPSHSQRITKQQILMNRWEGLARFDGYFWWRSMGANGANGFSLSLNVCIEQLSTERLSCSSYQCALLTMRMEHLIEWLRNQDPLCPSEKRLTLLVASWWMFMEWSIVSTRSKIHERHSTQERYSGGMILVDWSCSKT